MMKLRNTHFVKFADDLTTPLVRAEIDVDTTSELPGINGISGVRLHQGSTALIIKEGILAVLAGDGSWVDQTGTVLKEASNESA